MFTKAITRNPGVNFSNGLTTSTLGKPDFELIVWKFKISENSNIDQILEQLKTPIIEDEINITTLEWWNIYDTDEYLTKQKLINAWEFIDYVTNNEKIEALINFQYHFSNHQFYKDRHTKRFNFIKNILLKERDVRFVYLWSLERDLGLYASFQTIYDATNGEVNDTHFSFNGHFNFAHFLNSMINKKIL